MPAATRAAASSRARRRALDARSILSAAMRSRRPRNMRPYRSCERQQWRAVERGRRGVGWGDERGRRRRGPCLDLIERAWVGSSASAVPPHAAVRHPEPSRLAHRVSLLHGPAQHIRQAAQPPPIKRQARLELEGGGGGRGGARAGLVRAPIAGCPRHSRAAQWRAGSLSTQPASQPPTLGTGLGASAVSTPSRVPSTSTWIERKQQQERSISKGRSPA